MFSNWNRASTFTENPLCHRGFVLLSVLVVLIVSIAAVSASGFAGTAVASSDEIIVNETGSGDYESIEDAINASEPGDTILVEDGTYNESVLVDVENLTIIAAEGHTPVVDGEVEEDDNLRVAFNVSNAENVTLDGLTIRNHRPEMIVSNASDGLELRNLDLDLRFEGLGSETDTTVDQESSEGTIISGRAINLEYSNETVIESNKITGENPGRGEAIQLRNSIDPTVDNNTIEDLGTSITLWDSPGATVTNNSVDDLLGDAVLTGSGIRLVDSNETRVENNDMYRVDHNGVSVTRSHDVEVRNNLIDHAPEAGIRGLDSPNITVEENVVEGFGGSLTSGIEVAGASHNGTVFQNNITSTGTGVLANQESSDVTFEQNVIAESERSGIEVANASGIVFDANEVIDGEIGLSFESPASLDTEVRNNVFSGNAADMDIINATNAVVADNEMERGILMRGWERSDADHEFTDNTVGGDPLEYVHDEDGYTVTGEPGQVIVVDSTDIVVDGTTHEDVVAPVQVRYSEDVTVTDIDSSGTIVPVADLPSWYDGIVVSESTEVTVANSVITNSSQGGIGVIRSDNTTIEESTLQDNQRAGIRLGRSDGPVIVNNTVERTGAGGHGLELTFPGPDGEVTNNTFADNNRGIEATVTAADPLVRWSFSENVLRENARDGMWIGGDADEVDLTHNEFVRNEREGLDYGGTPALNATDNWWNHPTGPSGGEQDPDTGTVADGDGEELSGEVRFDPWLDEPVVGPDRLATFEWSPESPLVDESVEFDAARSYSIAGGIQEYRWDVTGNGTVDEVTNESNVVHDYALPGSYDVELEIEDGDGETTSVTERVNVAQEMDTEWTFTQDQASFGSGATVVDGMVYTAEFDGILYALDTETETDEWEFEAEDWIRGVPAVSDDTVYTGDRNGTLYALDADSGDEDWTYHADDEIQTSPTVSNDTVYFGSDDNHIYAVDAATGDEEWTFETNGTVESSATVVDGTVYIGSDDNHTYALNAETGLEQWRFETDGPVESSPTVTDGTVYVGSNDENLYALDAETGAEDWYFETGDEVVSSPTAFDGTVYVGSNDEHVYAIDADTGALEWEFEAAGSVRQSPTVAHGIVYVGADKTGGGVVYGLDAETGQSLLRSELGANPSTPIVVEGTVYVGSNFENFYALDGWIAGSSEGTRVLLETLGHHNGELVGPTAEFAVHSDVFKTGSEIQFDALRSSAPGGIEEYRWDFTGDGSFEETTTEFSTTHIYDDPGRYNVTLQIVYGDGQTAETSKTLDVPAWEFETDDEVYSSPTIVEDTVYVGSDDNNLYAVHADNGSEKWSFEAGLSVRSSPTVGDDVVYVGSNDDNLYAIHADNGSEKWSFETGDTVFSSPTVVDDVVYVGSADDHVYAIHAHNGSEKWSYDTGNDVWSSPTVVDDVVYVGSYPGAGDTVHALHADNGSKMWGYEIDAFVYSSPTVADGTVYVGSSDSYVYAFDAETGTKEWKFETDDSVWSSPTVDDDLVYVGSEDWHLYAIHATNGTEAWEFETQQGIESSPTVADGVVYFGGQESFDSEDGRIYGLDAQTGDQVWHFDLGGPIYSSPTVYEGVVYVGNSDFGNYRLLAIGAATDGSSSDSRVLGETLGHHDGDVETGDAFFDVGFVDLPSEVKDGFNLTVDYEVENTGDATGTQDVSLFVESEEVNVTQLTLAESESEARTVIHNTLEDDVGDLNLTVETDDDTAEATVEVLHSVVTYADGEGVVGTDGLLDAISDWRGDDIDTDLLLDVINAWRSGEDVT